MQAKSRIGTLNEQPYLNSVIVVWGFTYWFGLLLEPGLVASIDPAVSAAGLAITGGIVLGNLLLDSDAVWVLLGLFMTAGIVSSWVGTTQWAVPLPPEIAAVSMAAANGVAAIAFFAKVLAC